MNKLSKSSIILFLAFLFGSCFEVCSVQAQNNELVLEVTKECDIQYAGDICVAEMKLTNNTDEILDGTASLHIDYQGVCGDGPFDGEGIEAQFSIIDDNWLDFSDWENGTAIVSGFDIANGETYPKLKIETTPSLCPGNYTFTLTIEGTAETVEEYATIPVTLGSSGLPVGPAMQDEDKGEDEGEDEDFQSGESEDGDAGDGADGDGDGDGDTEDGGAGDTGDTGAEGDAGAGAGDTGAGAGDTGDTGDDWEEGFEYGDDIWEHIGDDQLDLFGDDPSSAKATAGKAKFLASIGAFFNGLEGWRLALMFLLLIILALIILRLIKAWIDRKKN